MRTKYSIWRQFPVIRNGKIVYTSSKHYNFTFQVTALIALYALKLWDKLAHADCVSQYETSTGRIREYSYYSATLERIAKHSVKLDLGDAGGDYGGMWVGIEFETHGDNLSELLENATVSGTDQDGGEVFTDSLMDTGYSDECIKHLEELTGETFDKTEFGLKYNGETVGHKCANC